MLLLPFAAVSIVIAGCGSTTENDATTAIQPEKPTVSSEPKASTTTPEAKELKVGMDLVEVKEIKGAPDEAKHQHGQAGQEYDIWIWSDVQATIENGKVIKVEKR
jgi:hypothetical protein